MIVWDGLYQSTQLVHAVPRTSYCMSLFEGIISVFSDFTVIKHNYNFNVARFANAISNNIVHKKLYFSLIKVNKCDKSLIVEKTTKVYYPQVYFRLPSNKRSKIV